MQIYLVGGAVRDELLGLPVSDRDWVVVGATPDDLIKLGFQQVGKKFPVFLHPKTHEAYALARTEQKIGIGYTGFSFYTQPDISIEDDLLRRDLSINAIAKNKHGKLIDPYRGEQDIKNRLLRHVSNAFIEDPLRILRVARFAAKLAKKKFKIAYETEELMKKMVNQRELETLSAERVWSETKKALQTCSPDVYFQVLYNCGALAILFPEINRLFSIPETKKKLSAEINVGIHTLTTLKITALLTDNVDIRFAALCHDFGKIFITEKCPKTFDYGIQGIPLIEKMCNRLRIPNKVKKLAKLVAEFHQYIHHIYQLEPVNIINLFDKINSWKKPERINQLSVICEADFRTQTKKNNVTYLQKKIFFEAFKIAKKTSAQKLIKNNITGSAFKDQLTQQRIKTLKTWWKKKLTM
ncbi:multifunctional CCA addition/repair protein [Arsenophonus symbiont of Ornithomya chloropus]|uniref:multifunctional CCA addition/repair protein n=1 Tax=Arsenophonus symbiont of Ornithomya chloropus TaxID=634121 RepID=UPI0032B0FBBC